MPASAAKTEPTPKTRFRTIAEVQERLGHVPEARILSFPAPGTATVQDLLDGKITGDRGHELIDGILVEKATGFRDDHVGTRLIFAISHYLESNNIGLVAGAQGLIRFNLDLVRVPDVSFIRWDSVDDPDEIENPAGAFLEYPPDLAVEVLSPGNSVGEMDVKLAEYAKAKVKLVWYVDPERREVDVFPRASAKRKRTRTAADTLDGGDVLPGFAVPVAKLFEKRAPAKKLGKKGRK
jgi:Uma2 family endonuclease